MKEEQQNMSNTSSKKILITGGTGSLGKALVRRLLDTTDWEIIVYSRDEGKQALSFFRKNPRVTCVIGDIRDFKKLDTTFKIHQPHYVIHAAALKRIDDMEFYPDECVKTNVNGSENVAIASLKSGVEKCILVSTDKACQPVNVYGSSKFIAERIFTNFDYNSKSTIFASVRYGNVIASRGSFIPLWLQQVKSEEKVTVTSMECSRFLFTLGDAVDTVLSSLKHAQGGEVFIPKINSYSMGTIISTIGEIVGGYPYPKAHIDTRIIGMRPGEKIHEDMLAKTELEFTYEIADGLLVVLPQYTNKTHTYTEKYMGKEFNSSLHLCEDTQTLKDLISKGLSDAD